MFMVLYGEMSYYVLIIIVLYVLVVLLPSVRPHVSAVPLVLTCRRCC